MIILRRNGRHNGHDRSFGKSNQHNILNSCSPSCPCTLLTVGPDLFLVVYMEMANWSVASNEMATISLTFPFDDIQSSSEYPVRLPFGVAESLRISALTRLMFYRVQYQPLRPCCSRDDHLESLSRLSNSRTYCTVCHSILPDRHFGRILGVVSSPRGPPVLAVPNPRFEYLLTRQVTSELPWFTDQNSQGKIYTPLHASITCLTLTISVSGIRPGIGSQLSPLNTEHPVFSRCQPFDTTCMTYGP